MQQNMRTCLKKSYTVYFQKSQKLIFEYVHGTNTFEERLPREPCDTLFSLEGSLQTVRKFVPSVVPFQGSGTEVLTHGCALILW